MSRKTSYAKKEESKEVVIRTTPLRFLPRLDRQPKKGRHIFPNGIKPSTIEWMPWE